ELTSFVRQYPPAAVKIRVQWRVMLVELMDIAPTSISLPDLDERASNWVPRIINHAAGDNNPLADRLTGSDRVLRQIMIERPNTIRSKHGSGYFGDRLRPRQ